MASQTPRDSRDCGRRREVYGESAAKVSRHRNSRTSVGSASRGSSTVMRLVSSTCAGIVTVSELSLFGQSTAVNLVIVSVNDADTIQGCQWL